MDIRNVYVIIDHKEFTKDKVVQELKEEGYKHNFFFGNAPFREDFRNYMYKCDEVWVFGNCNGMEDYNFAKIIGKDLWQMG